MIRTALPASRFGKCVALAAATWLLLVASCGAEFLGSDPWQNIGPMRAPAGLAGAYSWDRYDLDSHVDVSVGHPSGAVGAMRQETAQFLFDVFVVMPMKLVVDLFAFAFSLNLLTGPDGILPAMNAALQRFNQNVQAQGWMLAAITVLAGWSCLKALQRKPGEILGAFVTSAACAIGLGVLISGTVPLLTAATNFAHGAAGQFLTAFQSAPGDKRDPQVVITDHLTDVFVLKPWMVAEFGGLRHCVNERVTNEDGYPQPVAANDPARTVCRDHLHRDKNGYGGYAQRFLAQAPRSGQRTAEYDAIKNGEIPDHVNGIIFCNPSPCHARHIPPQFGPDYKVDKNDSPAVDLMQEDGAQARLRMVCLLVLAAFPAWFLLGRYAAVVAISEIIAIALWMMLPIVLVVGIMPWGQRLVKWWLTRMGLSLFIRVVYAVHISGIVAVASALYSLTDGLGFQWAMALVSIFYWTVLLFRKTITGEIGNAITGQSGAMRSGTGALTVAAAVSVLRPYSRMTRRMRGRRR